MRLLQMSDVDLSGARVMIREDFNVPMQGNVITNDKRLFAALPTIQAVLQAGASVILLSHLGRPKEGPPDPTYSLAPVAAWFREKLKYPVRLVSDWLPRCPLGAHEVVLCENVRFQVGEVANDEALGRAMARLCDVFIMDAFATSHRAQASTVGVATYAPIAIAGPLLLAELQALAHVMTDPKKPVVAIVGGAKVSTKLLLLKQLIPQVQCLLVGGGIANTLLASVGRPVGQSLYEPALLQEARGLISLAEKQGCILPLPEDVVVTEDGRTGAIVTIDEISDNMRIQDLGPKTIQHFTKLIQTAHTIIWNGPMGVFEVPAFARGTDAIAQAIASSSAYSLAGGGDTLAAIELFNIGDKLSYISTGGGAFLEYIEGKPLPAVEILGIRAHSFLEGSLYE